MVVSLLFCAIPFLVLAQKFNFDVQVEHYCFTSISSEAAPWSWPWGSTR
jgi:hypothetical protein